MNIYFFQFVFFLSLKTEKKIILSISTVSLFSFIVFIENVTTTPKASLYIRIYLRTEELIYMQIITTLHIRISKYSHSKKSYSNNFYYNLIMYIITIINKC